MPKTTATTKKAVVLIDGANLYSTAKALGLEVDFRKLKEALEKGRELVRLYYFTAVPAEDGEYASIRPLIDWLDYNGYTLVTKPTKEFSDASGRRKVKGNMDVEIAVEAINASTYAAEIILFSGDGDFTALVEDLKKRGCRVTVVSTLMTQPPMVADILRRSADEFLDLDNMKVTKSRG